MPNYILTHESARAMYEQWFSHDHTISNPDKIEQHFHHITVRDHDHSNGNSVLALEELQASDEVHIHLDPTHREDREILRTAKVLEHIIDIASGTMQNQDFLPKFRVFYI